MSPRELAIKNGHRTYVGNPCIRGHSGLRSVSNYACRECQKIWASENKAMIPAITSKSYWANKEKHKARSAKYSRENRAKRNASHKAWIEAHPGWYAKREAEKSFRCPAWSKSQGHQEKIMAIYKEAAELTARGFPHEVDHYYPLRGKTVSGLHVSNNLEVIPAKINHMKYNMHPNDFYIPREETIMEAIK